MKVVPVLALLAAGFVLMPATVSAQLPAFSDSTGSVEFGFVHEWFHRELEPAVYSDTRWSITSLLLTYAAADRVSLGLQGGLSAFESEDFKDSDYTRFAIGGSLSIRVIRRGPWDLGASGRYLETFDLDGSSQQLHKRVQSAYGFAFVGRSFLLFDQAVVLRAGPIYADDRVQTYAWDARVPVESSSGGAWGAALDGHLIVAKHISLYATVNYVEDFQGGIGAALHVGKGGI